MNERYNLTSGLDTRHSLRKPSGKAWYLADSKCILLRYVRSSYDPPRKWCDYCAYRPRESRRRGSNDAKTSHHSLKEGMRSAHQVAHGRGRASRGCVVWRKRTGRPQNGSRPNHVEPPQYTQDILHLSDLRQPRANDQHCNGLSRVAPREPILFGLKSI